MADWEVVIGLEIHAQLATKSKIFSGSATAYGAPPNMQADLVDLAYPGVLPVLNAEALRMAIKFGLAIGAKIDDPITMYLNDIYTIGANLAGLPGLSTPCGLIDGLPMGLQLVGPHFSEAKLLSAAHHYQRATDWHLRAPGGYQ